MAIQPIVAENFTVSHKCERAGIFKVSRIIMGTKDVPQFDSNPYGRRVVEIFPRDIMFSVFPVGFLIEC